MPASPFFWYELMTTEPKAATDFYTKVVGWTPQAFPGMDYTILNVAPEHGAAGVMAIPADASGTPPMWFGYIHATDVDAKARDIEAAGGQVTNPPRDIPGVGRFAVVEDPHGAAFMIMAPEGEDRPPLPMTTLGTVGWRELAAGEVDGALAFYADVFGWSKGETIPMGPMGDYQLFHAGGADAYGGMMAKMPDSPVPSWLFYFVVPAIDAARDRVVAEGGAVTMEPMEVPGGGFAMEAVDPQGARFGLTAGSR